MPVNPDEIAEALPLSAVAKALNVSEPTIRRMVSRGEIEIVRIGSGRGRLYVTRRALTDYVNRRAERRTA